MQSTENTAPAEPVKGPLHGFYLLVKPEPWLSAFLRNLVALFRWNSRKAWMTAAPGEYWADALVDRPVAWNQMLLSFVGHVVVVALVYVGNLIWLNQPHVIVEDSPQTATILHYQVSEYLPAMSSSTSREIPLRPKEQAADPELAPQRIVTLNVDHNSTRQTLIQPNPLMLQHDVPLPNIATWTAVPMAPVATRPTVQLPSGAPEVAPPSQAAAQSAISRLTFPIPQPQVVAPSSPVAVNRQAPQIISMSGPIVIPPAEDVARLDSSRLQLAVQAPQVAAPSSPSMARSNFGLLTPVGRAEVVPPPQATARHDVGAIGAPGPGLAVAPPSAAITGGMGRSQMREAGQLLALSVQPAPPNADVTVPEGNRKGEFAAGPEGHAGASGAPETKAGAAASAGPAGVGKGPTGVFVDQPPGRITNGVTAAPRLPPPVASADYGRSDRIDNEIFGSRRRYSMHLNMPNLNSAMGSWTVRFAELNAESSARGDLSAPEAIHKVDPAYPANLIKEQVEGVVVLHAVIRADGTVADVRVLQGFYQELDENARAALEQWRFRPGTKNGVPVDVEAVIRVPFRVSRLGF
jgi:TonB family protein